MGRRTSKLLPTFTIPDDKTKPLKQGLHRIPPAVQAQAAVMSSDDKRQRAAYILAQYNQTLTMRPVKSNAELIERAQDYFDFCMRKRLYPTIEGLASFCGYGSRTLLYWQNHERNGFSDGDESTADIVSRLKGIIDSLDGDLALAGEINPISWIFRRKATSGWVEANKLTIETTGGESRPPLSAEEIARRLPDPDADYNVSEGLIDNETV